MREDLVRVGDLYECVCHGVPCGGWAFGLHPSDTNVRWLQRPTDYVLRGDVVTFLESTNTVIGVMNYRVIVNTSGLVGWIVAVEPHQFFTNFRRIA